VQDSSPVGYVDILLIKHIQFVNVDDIYPAKRTTFAFKQKKGYKNYF